MVRQETDLLSYLSTRCVGFFVGLDVNLTNEKPTTALTLYNPGLKIPAEEV